MYFAGTMRSVSGQSVQRLVLITFSLRGLNPTRAQNTSPPVSSSSDLLCSHTCSSNGNGECDDGGSGAESETCDLGTDCVDCAPRSSGCLSQVTSQNCPTASDGECDDGGPGAEYCVCNIGTDCFDCGLRVGRERRQECAVSYTREDAPCFPSSATVVLASGAKRSLNTLQLGDEIVVATAAGVLTTDTVSALTLADNNAVSTFLVLSTVTGHNVTLTEGHHVPVGPSCCATLKTASEMKLGDTMWIVSTTGAAIPAAVTKIAQVSKMGLHSPVMTHGSFPLVDGVVTAFDSIHMVTAAGYFLPMLETTGTIELFKSVALHRERKYI